MSYLAVQIVLSCYLLITAYLQKIHQMTCPEVPYITSPINIINVLNIQNYEQLIRADKKHNLLLLSYSVSNTTTGKSFKVVFEIDNDSNYETVFIGVVFRDNSQRLEVSKFVQSDLKKDIIDVLGIEDVWDGNNYCCTNLMSQYSDFYSTEIKIGKSTIQGIKTSKVLNSSKNAVFLHEKKVDALTASRTSDKSEIKDAKIIHKKSSVSEKLNEGKKDCGKTSESSKNIDSINSLTSSDTTDSGNQNSCERPILEMPKQLTENKKGQTTFINSTTHISKQNSTLLLKTSNKSKNVTSDRLKKSGELISQNKSITGNTKKVKSKKGKSKKVKSNKIKSNKAESVNLKESSDLFLSQSKTKNKNQSNLTFKESSQNNPKKPASPIPEEFSISNSDSNFSLTPLNKSKVVKSSHKCDSVIESNNLKSHLDKNGASIQKNNSSPTKGTSISDLIATLVASDKTQNANASEGITSILPKNVTIQNTNKDNKIRGTYYYENDPDIKPNV